MTRRRTVLLAIASVAICPAIHAQTLVTEFVVHSEPAFTRVSIQADAPIRYRYGELAAPPRFYLDLLDARMGPKMRWQTILVGDTFLHRVRSATRTGSITRIVLELNPGVRCKLGARANHIVLELTR